MWNNLQDFSQDQEYLQIISLIWYFYDFFFQDTK